jgi:hypothetical protein
LNVFIELVEKVKCGWNRTRIWGTLPENLSKYMIILRWIQKKKKKASDYFLEKIKTFIPFLKLSLSTVVPFKRNLLKRRHRHVM